MVFSFWIYLVSGKPFCEPWTWTFIKTIVLLTKTPKRWIDLKFFSTADIVFAYTFCMLAGDRCAIIFNVRRVLVVFDFFIVSFFSGFAAFVITIHAIIISSFTVFWELRPFSAKMHSSSLNLNLNSNWNRNSTVRTHGYSLIEIAYRLHRQTDDHSYYGWSLHKSSNCYAWKKEAKFINLCVLSSCLLCDDNKRPQMLNRQMTEMNDDLMRGYALFCHCVLAWCTTIRNEWVLWLNLSNAFTHTHFSSMHTKAATTTRRPSRIQSAKQ